MSHPTRHLLPILALAFSGVFATQLAAQQQAVQSASDELTATQKLKIEINTKLFPLRMRVGPTFLSRRKLPPRETNHLDIVLLSAPDAEVVPLQVTIKRGLAAPVHYASGRYDRKKKILELKYQPAKGAAVWLEPTKWYLKSRPVS